jgi:intracellular sulfur oxidation DsrE/DsrF family protein
LRSHDDGYTNLHDRSNLIAAARRPRTAYEVIDVAASHNRRMDSTMNVFHATRGAFLRAGAAGAMVAAALNLHDLQGALHTKARRKTLIAATRIDRGASMHHAVNVMNAFEYTYGEGAGALHVAAVFYGSALFYAVNDDVWGRYHLFDVLDQASDGLPQMLHTPQNPFLRANAAEGRNDASIETLMRRGLTVIVCNTAMHTITRTIAEMQHVDERRVYEDFLQNLVPGTLVVPAGVAAIVLAQEAGYTYLGE